MCPGTRIVPKPDRSASGCQKSAGRAAGLALHAKRQAPSSDWRSDVRPLSASSKVRQQRWSECASSRFTAKTVGSLSQRSSGVIGISPLHNQVLTVILPQGARGVNGKFHADIFRIFCIFTGIVLCLTLRGRIFGVFPFCMVADCTLQHQI